MEVWVAVATLVVATLIWSWISNPRVCPGPPLLPILGDLTLFRLFIKGNHLPKLAEYTKKYGSIVQTKFFAFRRQLFIVTDPEFVRFILRESKLFPGRSPALPIRFVAPKGLLVLPSNDMWKMHRNALTPVLSHKDYLSRYVVEMNEICTRMMERIPSGVPIDISSLMIRTTLDVICRVGFNYESKSLDDPDSNFLVVSKRLFEDILVRSMLGFYYHFSKVKVRFETNLKFIRDVAKRAIGVASTAIDSAEEKSTESSSLKKLNFIAALKGSRETLGEEEIIDESITMLLAGHETTSNTLSWTLYLLAKHPDLQEKAHHKAISALEQGSVPDFEALNDGKFQYLEAVIYESLRHFPTVPFFGRFCSESFEFSGYKFKKNSIFWIAPVVNNMDPKYWDKPEEFRPERFVGITPEQESEMRTNKAFLPFGGGNRSCIGKRFAMIETTLILARLLQRFRFEIDPSCDELRGKSVITLSPEKPLMVKCILRS